MSSFQGQTVKSRTKVKPILRKLTQSEKNSLDLDRPAAEQDGLGIYDYGTAARSVHDVSFTPTGRRGYHNRSTSGTSQFSTTTTGSGHRAGSFVHPFQQTPRPYTPPLVTSSYQNSLRESDHSNSPAVLEDEDPSRHNYRSTSNLSNRTPSITSTIVSPVLAQPLRIQTKQSSSSRLALATSHTSLHNILSADLISPSDTITPTSAMRTSMDKGFRIRSRSEVDPRSRTETIQEARRKFQEKEQAKEEKAAREEIKALEKRNQKEAKQIERGHGHRRSSASDTTRNKRSKSDLTVSAEKTEGLVGREYGSVSGQTPPFTGDGFEELPRQVPNHHIKKKTHSAWTKLMMWLRTRFIRMGRKRDPSQGGNVQRA